MTFVSTESISLKTALSPFIRGKRVNVFSQHTEIYLRFLSKTSTFFYLITIKLQDNAF